MWVSPVPDEILSYRLPIPTLNIFCDDFVMWTPKKTPHELDGVLKHLDANNDKKDSKNNIFLMKGIKGTKHQFFADVPFWFPAFLSSFAGISGKTSITISRTCLEKLIMKFLSSNKTTMSYELTNEENGYVYNVNSKMLNPPDSQL